MLSSVRRIGLVQQAAQEDHERSLALAEEGVRAAAAQGASAIEPRRPAPSSSRCGRGESSRIAASEAATPKISTGK